MIVLVINAGSSSLKYQLLDTKTKSVMAKGLAERIGIEGSLLSYTKEGCAKIVRELPLPTHQEAITEVLSLLTDSEHGAISSMEEINAVGHRVVHGGEKFSDSALIDAQVKAAIKDCIALAPLHNPANLTGIEACEKAIPVPQVAVFDTAFHQTMPSQAYMYAIPYEYYEKYGVRRYGFHGTSHKYVANYAAEKLDKDIKDLKIITCHLGNGSSIAAIKNGVCIDTSMGLTPLAGVPMGTRSGDIDPAIIKYLMDKEPTLSLNDIDTILNKKSGMEGISGVSSDFRDLNDAAVAGNERAQLALDMFFYHVRKYIGAYSAAMGGVDVIIFTAGVGENGDVERQGICSGLGYLGVKLNEEANKGLRGKFCDISMPDSKVKVLVVPTNEELSIAMETERLVQA